MNEILFVGDIHGLFTEFNQLIKQYPYYDIIQLGDLGLGFDTKIDKLLPKKGFKFIRGNHDKPINCKQHPFYLGDFGIYKNMFFVSGGLSIDKAYRTENVTWWKDEELDYKSFSNMINLYENTKPDIVFSHVAPTSFNTHIGLEPIISVTGTAMDQMLHIHSPKKWICGHYHFSKITQFNYCEFVVLPELGTYLLKINP